MSTLDAKRVRLFANQATRTADLMTDIYTGSSPEIWRGNAVDFEIGIGHAGALQEDISNIQSLTLDVKPYATRSGDAVMTKTLAAGDLDGTITAAQWNANTHQHALVSFAANETNVTLPDGTNSQSYWLVVAVVTGAGKPITLRAAELLIVEDGTGSAGPAPELRNTYLTAEQCLAIFQKRHEDGASVQFKDGQHDYHYCEEDGLWYPTTVKLVDGHAVIGLGDGESL